MKATGVKPVTDCLNRTGDVPSACENPEMAATLSEPVNGNRLQASVALILRDNLLLESLSECLGRVADISVIWSATSMRQASSRIIDDPPDIALVDGDLPNGSGFDLTQRISAELPETGVIVMKDRVSDCSLSLALRSNISGFIVKDESISFVIDSIRRVAHGGHSFSRAAACRLRYDPVERAYRLSSDENPRSLTARQLEILSHLAEAASVKEVARTLKLSPKSIDSHKYRIMQKLGIHDRVKLARYAIREGLTTP